ncbi:MAG: hypothetical protein R2762_09825 [Bryobacteraceae bacterium]
MTIRLIPAVAWLLFQLGAIVYARFVPSRYFCWAPYDMQTEYVVQASVGGRELTPAEIRARYRRPARGVDNRSVQHVIDIFEQTEQRYHRDDPAAIVIKYVVNGHRKGEWRRGEKQWPER